MYPQKDEYFGKDWIEEIIESACGSVVARSYRVRTGCCGAVVEYGHKALKERARNAPDFCKACYVPGMHTQRWLNKKKGRSAPLEDVKGWGTFLTWHKEPGRGRPPQPNRGPYQHENKSD